MKQLFLVLAALLVFGSVAKADAPLGVIVAPKQNIGSTFHAPSTSVGASYRIISIGHRVNLSGIAVVTDNQGVKYGADAGIRVYDQAEIGIGTLINFNNGTFSKPFLALTVRL